MSLRSGGFVAFRQRCGRARWPSFRASGFELRAAECQSRFFEVPLTEFFAVLFCPFSFLPTSERMPTVTVWMKSTFGWFSGWSVQPIVAVGVISTIVLAATIFFAMRRHRRGVPALGKHGRHLVASAHPRICWGAGLVHATWMTMGCFVCTARDCCLVALSSTTECFMCMLRETTDCSVATVSSARDSFMHTVRLITDRCMAALPKCFVHAMWTIQGCCVTTLSIMHSRGHKGRVTWRLFGPVSDLTLIEEVRDEAWSAERRAMEAAAGSERNIIEYIYRYWSVRKEDLSDDLRKQLQSGNGFVLAFPTKGEARAFNRKCKNSRDLRTRASTVIQSVCRMRLPRREFLEASRSGTRLQPIVRSFQAHQAYNSLVAEQTANFVDDQAPVSLSSGTRSTRQRRKYKKGIDFDANRRARIDQMEVSRG